jgi:hypothetical protein
MPGCGLAAGQSATRGRGRRRRGDRLDRDGLQHGDLWRVGPAKAPAVIVLKQGADNSNGDIFFTRAGAT